MGRCGYLISTTRVKKNGYGKYWVEGTSWLRKCAPRTCRYETILAHTKNPSEARMMWMDDVKCQCNTTLSGYAAQNGKPRKKFALQIMQINSMVVSSFGASSKHKEEGKCWAQQMGPTNGPNKWAKTR